MGTKFRGKQAVITVAKRADFSAFCWYFAFHYYSKLLNVSATATTSCVKVNYWSAPLFFFFFLSGSVSAYIQILLSVLSCQIGSVVAIALNRLCPACGVLVAFLTICGRWRQTMCIVFRMLIMWCWALWCFSSRRSKAFLEMKPLNFKIRTAIMKMFFRLTSAGIRRRDHLNNLKNKA